MKKIHQVCKNASARSATLHIFSSRVDGIVESLSAFSTLSAPQLRQSGKSTLIMNVISSKTIAIIEDAFSKAKRVYQYVRPQIQ